MPTTCHYGTERIGGPDNGNTLIPIRYLLSRIRVKFVNYLYKEMYTRNLKNE